MLSDCLANVCALSLKPYQSSTSSHTYFPPSAASVIFERFYPLLYALLDSLFEQLLVHMHCFALPSKKALKATRTHQDHQPPGWEHARHPPPPTAHCLPTLSTVIKQLTGLSQPLFFSKLLEKWGEGGHSTGEIKD